MNLKYFAIANSKFFSKKSREEKGDFWTCPKCGIRAYPTEINEYTCANCNWIGKKEEFVGKIPARTVLTVLQNDDMPERVVGWTIQENIGIAVVNPKLILYQKIKRLFPFLKVSVISKIVDIVWWISYPIRKWKLGSKRDLNKIEVY